MKWEWKLFFVVFMLWMTKSAAAYLARPDASQLKDYGPSMTYKEVRPGWNPNQGLQ